MSLVAAASWVAASINVKHNNNLHGFIISTKSRQIAAFLASAFSRRRDPSPIPATMQNVPTQFRI
jgi:hypothetical protein